MKLDEHFLRLIAIGASIACNCQPCLETNLARAKECGADETELNEAMWVGKMVRRGAASKMDTYATNLVLSKDDHGTLYREECGCEP